MRKTALLLAALAACSSPALAGGFSDNFDSENGGLSALNYTGFANFTTDGQVDLVNTPDYGIICSGGSGSCVDLDGTSGPGALFSNSFSYNANDVITLSFDLGGSQRVLDGSDLFEVALFTTTEGTLADSFSILSTAGFSNYVYSFQALNAGSLFVGFGTTSHDNIGPLLDNVSLNIAAVPEPATWAMMIGGFALAGAAMRRRKTAVSFA